MNVSIKQLTTEIKNAKAQALRDPYQFERSDMVIGLGEEANTLTDTVLTKNRMNISGTRNFPAEVREKVDAIFEKFPDQLKILGLYYDAGFTAEEIADTQGSQEDSVTRSLRRAKARLKKYLTAVEYDSIRWAIGDAKSLDATQPRFVNPFHSEFVAPQPVRTGKLTAHGMVIEWEDGFKSFLTLVTPVRRKIKGLHPEPKDLPLPRWMQQELPDAVS
ncbi:hypothetical protein ASG85_14210 [Paenibacillus sp. Soil724D2]|nr:hypothetical protein ASG85_14210 [Paenibacillus sp. Soil724D2]